MSSAPTATSWPQLPPQYQDTPTRPESPSYTQTNRFNAPSAECSSAECSSAECSQVPSCRSVPLSGMQQCRDAAVPGCSQVPRCRSAEVQPSAECSSAECRSAECRSAAAKIVAPKYSLGIGFRDRKPSVVGHHLYSQIQQVLCRMQECRNYAGPGRSSRRWGKSRT